MWIGAWGAIVVENGACGVAVLRKVSHIGIDSLFSHNDILEILLASHSYAKFNG